MAFINNDQDIKNNFVSKSELIEKYKNIDQQYKNCSAWAWGTNGSGSIGDGTVVAKSSPVQIGSLTNWKYILKQYIITGSTVAAAYGIKTDGTLWAWGDNATQYIFGNGLQTTVSTPIQVGTLTNWKQITYPSEGNLAVKTDGTLWAWGNNSGGGQLGLSDIATRSSPVQVGNLTNWKQVSTLNKNSAAIKKDGTLWAWGVNTFGNLGLGDITSRSSPVQVGNLTNWKYVVAGISNTVAIKTDGTLWAWGANQSGQLGLGNQITISSPVQVGSLTDWKYVETTNESFGGSSTSGSYIAIKTDGTLWAWGTNGSGRLGLGDTSGRSSPSQIQGSWASIYRSDREGFLAIRSDGTLWAWGVNTIGQLGLGDVISRSSPVQVGTESDWRSPNIRDTVNE
jgi:alpha-tubulin suppressor-like RCC1 family protein